MGMLVTESIPNFQGEVLTTGAVSVPNFSLENYGAEAAAVVCVT